MTGVMFSFAAPSCSSAASVGGASHGDDLILGSPRRPEVISDDPADDPPEPPETERSDGADTSEGNEEITDRLHCILRHNLTSRHLPPHSRFSKL